MGGSAETGICAALGLLLWIITTCLCVMLIILGGTCLGVDTLSCGPYGSVVMLVIGCIGVGVNVCFAALWFCCIYREVSREIEESRAYNKTLATAEKIHQATLDLTRV